MKKLLDEMSTKWTEVQVMLLQFEEQIDEQSMEVANLEAKNSKLEVELKNQMNMVNEGKAREFENEEVFFEKNINLLFLQIFFLS